MFRDSFDKDRVALCFQMQHLVDFEIATFQLNAIAPKLESAVDFRMQRRQLFVKQAARHRRFARAL